ncbi:ferredoxin [Clavibacter michiganensis]|uniref:ferredoxin n=1 Tax=Clavibacter michiganensis TaxID=28447 RepID=UPI003D668C7B
MTMRVHVDMSKCQYHGQCTISAPRHFEILPDGDLRYESDVVEDDVADIEDAVDACPAQAIAFVRGGGSSSSGPQP